ncbi:alpha-glucosidase [Vreelandella alkaliphila]|uniref:Alpha-glucosidase n=1 Tax=Vreelandella alkaliphila TaxID=272774 RepID=A0A7C9NPU7_9GAMM|nr:alpha-glucosidase [Halomonas alkaliphila]NDL70568.1 alpha-glucosidase [Halomonas alkaliphila]
MQVTYQRDQLHLRLAGEDLLVHTPDSPAFFIGYGREKMDMYCGNFEIQDYLESREALRHLTVTENQEGIQLELRRYKDDDLQLRLNVAVLDDGIKLQSQWVNSDINRFWVRLAAKDSEHVWGCGEQMSYFNLRGRNFPLWTSEPGVGRDKTTYVTWQSDAVNRAGGDYYNTNYPQPTFVSSRRYFCHVETYDYADFDFRHGEFHELQVWGVPASILLRSAPTFLALVEKISATFGRQPLLPDWVYNGVILGLKRGQTHAETMLAKALDSDMAVSAVWCEDWSGVRETSFGTRLFWDWRWQPERYPLLDQLISDLHARNVRFLGYVNPYLCVDGSLFPEAEAAGYLATNEQGDAALVDFGEFDCGVVDFTNEAACTWFKDVIIKREMLDLGISGWMADFGEYLPIDVKLSNGVSAKQEHNRWPVRWAQINAEAIAEAGLTDETTFFMRAGYTGVQAYCPLLWAGDQSVDFSRHDGLGTVICAALSSGLMGNAFHHSDIGGYTSLFGNKRDAELHMRWAEMAAFTPVMRTHESNRPTENAQWFDDPEVAEHLARMSRLYVSLSPYLKQLVAEGSSRGIPVQRALFLHFEADPECYDIQDQYLLGPDMLVAPVHKAGCDEWSAYLPSGVEWVHLWSGKHYSGGQRVTVAAPVGEPAVFYRHTSEWSHLFTALPGQI